MHQPSDQDAPAAKVTPEVMPIEANISLLRDEMRQANKLLGLGCGIMLVTALVIVATSRQHAAALAQTAGGG